LRRSQQWAFLPNFSFLCWTRINLDVVNE